ncbi:germin-like protein subfamily 1 member 20 [Mercurialis annua]|uniref:germin-like protein subfamily 1 member 20 n=1 Tax=Mercurialis annua TaxID=3986 RepID=UPI002160422A|nr:germin-like protein subfamily 1 member 20 [Mercurialis annua]
MLWFRDEIITFTIHKTMGIDKFLVIFIFLALSFSFVTAVDPAPLDDFCVALAPSGSKLAVTENGQLCKDPKLVTADDFFYSGLNIPSNTNNRIRSNLTDVTVKEIKGLNSLGISIGRIDFAPNGITPPTYHPRVSEIRIVLAGTIYVGFITSNPDHRVFAKILRPGDVFVVPVGLIHFVRNIGKTPAVLIVAYNGQNPDAVLVPNTIFGSTPPISPEVLVKSFQLDKKTVVNLQKQDWT